MKTAGAIFVIAALLVAPIACAIVVCPLVNTHDCCPKSQSFAACPLDILASAKAALPAIVTITLNSVPLEIGEAALAPIPSFTADDRDLHLQNRVLRI